MTVRTSAPADVDSNRTKGTSSRRPLAARRAVQSQPTAPWDSPAGSNSLQSSPNDSLKTRRSHRLPEAPSDASSLRRGRSLPVTREGERDRREGRERWNPKRKSAREKERVEGPLDAIVADASSSGKHDEAVQRRSTPTRPNPLLGTSSLSPPPIVSSKSSSSLHSGSRSPSRPNPLLVSSPQRKASREPSSRYEVHNSTAKADDCANTIVAAPSRTSKGARTRESQHSRKSSGSPAAFLASVVSAPSSSADVLTDMFSSNAAVDSRRSTHRRRQSLEKLVRKDGADNNAMTSVDSSRNGAGSGGSSKPARVRLAPWDSPTPDSIDSADEEPHTCKRDTGNRHAKQDSAESGESLAERPRLPVPEIRVQTGHSFSRTPSFDHDDGAIMTSRSATANFGDSDVEKFDDQSAVTLDPTPQRTLGRRARSGDAPVGFVMSPVREVSTSPSKKVPLSALASHAPLVRLVRIQDLSLPEWRSLGVTVPAYSLLGQRLHEQRMLGVSLNYHNFDIIALLRWYMPYSIVAFVYSIVVQLAGGSKQVLLFSLPLFVVLPLLHCTRLAFSDYQLHAAVDAGALVELQSQLQTPVERSGVMAATLGSALQAFRKTPLRLIRFPRLHLPIYSAIYTFAILMALLIFRVVRAHGVAALVEAEALTTYIVITIFVFFACSPLRARNRAQEADLRLLTLEAGFNSMLDSLRPLMSDLNGGILPTPALPKSGSEVVPSMWFPVRLISTDRNTLRAHLHFPANSSKLVVSCSLGEFALVADRVQSAFPTHLGVAAANPTLWSGGNHYFGSPVSGQGLSAVAATAGINLGVGRQRRREDDEYSTSLASVSTASTVRRGGNQPSETSLKLAMSMVAELNRHTNPLEAFRPHEHGGMVPPKAPVDEPALLFALGEDHARFVAGSGSHSGEVAGGVTDNCSICGRLKQCNFQGTSTAEDRFGVLRSLDGLERLCTAPSNVGTPAQFGAKATPLGRSFNDSDSDGYWSDEEQKPHPADAYIKETCSTFLKHLAILFDSVEERDRCLGVFEMSGYTSRRESQVGFVEP